MGKVLTETITFINNGEQVPGKVTVFIMTDGAENNSQEWDSDQVKRMIGELKELGWQFILLRSAAVNDGRLSSKALSKAVAHCMCTTVWL
jgi:hypothetical protein